MSNKKMTNSELKAFRRGLAIGNNRKKRTKKAVNPFAGADDVYFTKNSIAVKNVSTKNGKLEEKTRYLPKNEKNVVTAIRTGWTNIRDK